MICFQIPYVPKIGDTFFYDCRDYQLITIPKDAGLQGGLLRAEARYTCKDLILDKTFYFEVDSKFL